MKHYPLLLLAILACFCAKAQSKFVEVTVNDTLLVKADLFVYRIRVLLPSETRRNSDTAAPRRSPQGRQQRIAEDRQEQQQHYNQLAALLQQQGFRLKPPTLRERSRIGYDYDYFVLTVETGSADSLQRLVQLVEKDKDVNGTLSAALVTHEENYMPALYKKLLEKAGKKAMALALATGHQLGEVLTVSENRLNTGWTAYSPAAADTGNGGWNALSGSLTVRYQW